MRNISFWWWGEEEIETSVLMGLCCEFYLPKQNGTASFRQWLLIQTNLYTSLSRLGHQVPSSPLPHSGDKDPCLSPPPAHTIPGIGRSGVFHSGSILPFHTQLKHLLFRKATCTRQKPSVAGEVNYPFLSFTLLLLCSSSCCCSVAKLCLIL